MGVGVEVSDTAISIHAPARGATRSSSFKIGFEKFQSTLPRGERPCWRINSRHGSNFNPRSREGSDEILILKTEKSLYFNPRSREGSDIPLLRIVRFPCYFNPRSREGSDGSAISSKTDVNDFNPRSREGSDIAESFACSEI